MLAYSLEKMPTKNRMNIAKYLSKAVKLRVERE